MFCAVLAKLWRRSNRTVLIVSENRTDRSLDSAFLRHPEIRLLTSYPNEDAMTIARREHPNLIIEELGTADEVGLAFHKELKTHPGTRSIPIILVAPTALEQQANALEPNAILLKPFPRRMLFEAVSKFIPLPKRRHNRVKLNLRFSYDFDGRRRQAFSRDMSQNGAFLKSDRTPVLGERLRLEFLLPGAPHEIRCGAIVRNTTYGDSHAGQLNGFGVEFEEMSDQDSDIMDAFVERNLKRSLFSR